MERVLKVADCTRATVAVAVAVAGHSHRMAVTVTVAVTVTQSRCRCRCRTYRTRKRFKLNWSVSGAVSAGIDSPSSRGSDRASDRGRGRGSAKRQSAKQPKQARAPSNNAEETRTEPNCRRTADEVQLRQTEPKAQHNDALGLWLALDPRPSGSADWLCTFGPCTRRGPIGMWVACRVAVGGSDAWTDTANHVALRSSCCCCSLLGNNVAKGGSNMLLWGSACCQGRLGSLGACVARLPLPWHMLRCSASSANVASSATSSAFYLNKY